MVITPESNNYDWQNGYCARQYSDHTTPDGIEVAEWLTLTTIARSWSEAPQRKKKKEKDRISTIRSILIPAFFGWFSSFSHTDILAPVKDRRLLPFPDQKRS